MTLFEVIEAGFCEVSEPREGEVKHPLMTILSIALLSFLAGGEGWKDMEFYGLLHFDWLRRFLKFPYGVPSDSTFGRVISSICPVEFSRAMSEVSAYLIEQMKGESSGATDNVIALDGKTARRSHDRTNGTPALHSVSAFDTQCGLSLAQVSTSDKTNEITVIPELITMIDIRKSVVTIDAMGCQKSISKQIIEAGGDYIFALKANHGDFYDSMIKVFSDIESLHNIEGAHVAHVIEKGHGRIETRSCVAIPKFNIFGCSSEWRGLTSFICIESTREINGKISRERRFFISSLEADPVRLLGNIRSHWAIEASHWTLDVTFNEDSSRARIKNAQANLAILRKIARNILHSDNTQKISTRMKRWAAMDPQFLMEMLSQATV